MNTWYFQHDDQNPHFWLTERFDAIGPTDAYETDPKCLPGLTVLEHRAAQEDHCFLSGSCVKHFFYTQRCQQE